MSVFTPVSDAALAGWLAGCGAGAARTRHAVEGGVENSNWFVETDRGRFVLTLFEWQPAADAERTLALTAALADAGLPVARPWPQPGGCWTAPLAGKPAALSAWLDGTHPGTPTTAQCAAIGDFLARLHTIDTGAKDVGATQRVAMSGDARGLKWLRHTHSRLPPDPLAAAALAAAARIPELPAGTIHADLFRDNALFDGDRLCGVIDFHYACNGPFAYDVAVAAVDWCFAGDAPDPARVAALCDAYTSSRAPSAAERAAFAALAERAALRFWLSRAYDAAYPRPGRAVLVKPPAEMRARVAALRAAPLAWPG